MAHGQNANSETVESEAPLCSNRPSDPARRSLPMRSLRLLLVVSALAACQTSDLTLPAPPAKAQPGTVYSRDVYAKAGQSTPIPAAGASNVLLGTSITGESNADGNFLISGITQA